MELLASVMKPSTDSFLIRFPVTDSITVFSFRGVFASIPCHYTEFF